MTDTTNAAETDLRREQVAQILEMQAADPEGAFQALRALAPWSATPMVELGWAFPKDLGIASDMTAAEQWYRNVK